MADRQGNSNTITTVDISAGFVGLDNYIEVPAVFLTAFVTYSGPLLWSVHLIYYLNSESCRISTSVAHGCYSYAIIHSLPVTVYIILITILRYHLFIWSVFSPKLLYEVLHLFISVFVSSQNNQTPQDLVHGLRVSEECSLPVREALLTPALCFSSRSQQVWHKSLEHSGKVPDRSKMEQEMLLPDKYHSNSYAVVPVTERRKTPIKGFPGCSLSRKSQNRDLYQ
ncbi:GPI ethanolamine phosphate transferase 2 isoform X1 [Pelobates cultripes]|uniref:GPI ethanolamine phosphate transferase 2 isoform X1 n=1 Tax=Pelobates cultripes TaxID=61616 RepID=A0AAD1S879_PELCU|nr:GPI ethanolamine phosphate transferase 2 isoform X1 [Pelobates cultripes]